MPSDTLRQLILVNLSQIAVLYLFVLAGFLLVRLHPANAEATRPVSALLTGFFLPCMLISGIAAQLTPTALLACLLPFLFGCGVIALLWLPLKSLAGRLGDADSGGMLTYVMLFPNISYLGLPLAEAVLPELYLPMVFFGLPFTLAANTVGLRLICPCEGKVTAGKLLSPPVCAVILGSLCGLIPAELPAVLSDFLGDAGGCTGPLAMLLTGMVLAKGHPAVAHAASPKSGIAVAVIMRMLIIPTLMTGAAMLISLAAGLDGTLVMTVLAGLCLPSGLNLIFIAENSCRDSLIGAKCALISNLAGIVTIPAVYGLLTSWGI